MQTIINNKPKPFTPVSITLIFDSQAELDAIGSLFNCSPVREAVGKLDAIAPDYRQFEIAGADIHLTDEISNSLKEWYDYED